MSLDWQRINTHRIIERRLLQHRRLQLPAQHIAQCRLRPAVRQHVLQVLIVLDARNVQMVMGALLRPSQRRHVQLHVAQRVRLRRSDAAFRLRRLGGGRRGGGRRRRGGSHGGAGGRLRARRGRVGAALARHRAGAALWPAGRQLEVRRQRAGRTAAAVMVMLLVLLAAVLGQRHMAADVGRMADRAAVVTGRLGLLFPLVVGGLLGVVELGLPLGGEREGAAAARHLDENR